jgi:hypothetical protein
LLNQVNLLFNYNTSLVGERGVCFFDGNFFGILVFLFTCMITLTISITGAPMPNRCALVNAGIAC